MIRRRHDSPPIVLASRPEQTPATCTYDRCQAEPSTTLDLPLCDRHAIAVYRTVKATLDAAHH